jgi:hypothetical protein
MMKHALAIALAGGVAVAASAQMEITGTATIHPGDNVIAGAALNDSPGSSDLTLIIQVSLDGTVVFDEGDPIMAIQPMETIDGWAMPGFDASGWTAGENGVGYGDDDDNTTIGDGANAAVYMIGSFALGTTADELMIGVDYDDGCVILVNGVEVARTIGADIGDTVDFDSWTDQGSGQSHEASKTDPPGYEVLDIPLVVSDVEAGGKLATRWADLRK